MPIGDLKYKMKYKGGKTELHYAERALFLSLRNTQWHNNKWIVDGEHWMILTGRSTRALGCLVILAALCQATTPVNVPADWESYSSPEYAFTIQYPKDFSLCAGGLDFCENTSRSYIPACNDNTVDCFVYAGHEYDGTNFEGAALSVNILRDRRTEQDCNKIDVGPHPIKGKIINGIRFHYGMTGYGGLGHWTAGPKYRAFYDKVCFELAVNITAASFGNFDPGTIKKFDRTKLEKDFDAMLNTFRFTGPVADGPAWRVYHNGDVGGTFEYPDGDTVVKSVEYSQERHFSNEITDSTYFADHGLNYFVATKVDLRDRNALDAWLKSSGYPDLSKAQELRHSSLYTEYRAGNYWYVYGQAALHILGASDQQHNIVAPPNNVVFRHFLNSFKPD